MSLPRTIGAAVAFSLILTAAACEHRSPTAPTPPSPPIASATVTIQSMAVTGERSATGGYVYRVVVRLHESGGVAATVRGVELTFLSGTTVLMTSPFDQPIPGAGNAVPPNGTVDTRELAAADTTQAHPYATTVQAKVTYTDATATESTATGSADVPPLPPPPPVTYRLTGVITDLTTGRGIEAARLEVISGANLGVAATTDRDGAYAMPGLAAGTFRLRASAADYYPGEQNVTVPDVPRADFQLRSSQPQPPCAYTISPTNVTVGPGGGTFITAITRTSGSCGWQARSDAAWISFPSASSGNGNATLTYAVQGWGNTGGPPRTGTIFVEWSSGSVQLIVSQLPNTFCHVSLEPFSQTVPLAPATGQVFSFAVSVGSLGDPCLPWLASTSDAWIHIAVGSGNVDRGLVTFTVDPLASGTRTGTIVVTAVDGRATETITQQ